MPKQSTLQKPSIRAVARHVVMVLLGAIVLGPLRVAHADDEAVLPLSTFVAEVQGQSPEVQAARLRANASKLRVEPARALPDPFVALGIDEVALGVAERPGSGTAWPRPVLRYQVNQNFPLPPTRRALRSAAATRADQTAADVEIIRRTLRVIAVQLFLRARYVEAALRTNDRFVEVLENTIASAEARYSSGKTAHHEVLLAKAERALVLRDRLILERALAVLHAQMNELRGAPADREVPRLVDDHEDHRPGSFSLGSAMAGQPELRSATAAVSAADARIDVAKTSGYPVFSLQVMAMQSLTPEMPSSVGAMVGLTVPLYWKRKQGPEIDAARVDRSAADRDREALRRRLEAEWVAAHRAYETSLDTVDLYEKEILPATRAALESSEAGYATETVAFTELLDVLRASIAVELELVAAETDVRLARLRLEELLSGPPVLQLAPLRPTMFGPMGVGPTGMAGDAMPAQRPIRMGRGMQPAAPLDIGAETGAGMGGMR